MRVVVLGATGMLGHKVCQVLSVEHEVWAVVRSNERGLSGVLGIPGERLTPVTDLTSQSARGVLVETIHPEVIVNCVGVVKQSGQMRDACKTIEVNSVLPHAFAALAEGCGARFIHISTDCVFSGTRGTYSEDDFPDALDLYGRSKLLGEPDSPNALVLRTSIIGEEMRSDHGLVSWFLSATPPIHGYSNAFFSGLPTIVLAETIKKLLVDSPDLSGLFHVASDRISKLHLLELLGAAYGRSEAALPTAEPTIDRSLDGSRFAELADVHYPSWSDLIDRLVNDPWRNPTREWAR